MSSSLITNYRCAWLWAGLAALLFTTASFGLARWGRLLVLNSSSTPVSPFSPEAVYKRLTERNGIQLLPNVYCRNNIKTKEKVIIRAKPLFPGDRIEDLFPRAPIDSITEWCAPKPSKPTTLRLNLIPAPVITPYTPSESSKPSRCTRRVFGDQA